MIESATLSFGMIFIAVAIIAALILLIRVVTGVTKFILWILFLLISFGLIVALVNSYDMSFTFGDIFDNFKEFFTKLLDWIKNLF